MVKSTSVQTFHQQTLYKLVFVCLTFNISLTTEPIRLLGFIQERLFYIKSGDGLRVFFSAPIPRLSNTYLLYANGASTIDRSSRNNDKDSL